MPNLDLSIIPKSPIMDDACYYCTVPIRGKHVQISFEGKRTILMHIDEKPSCWDKFVTGINMIDRNLDRASMN